MSSQPSLFPELDFDVPKDISNLCDFNVDVGHESNLFNVLGGNNDNFESLGNLSGYDAALDPYCTYLMDKPRKIMWHTLFDFSFNFSMAFTLIKRALIFFVMLFPVLSYQQACEPHAEEFDKILRVLTASNLRARVLTCDGVDDAP